MLVGNGPRVVRIIALLSIIVRLAGCSEQDPSFGELSSEDTSALISQDSSVDKKQVLIEGKDALGDSFSGAPKEVISAKFQTSTKETVTGEVKLMEGIATQEIKLTSNKKGQSKKIIAPSQQLNYDVFTQGSNTGKVENFVQRSTGKGVLDVLVVVDSSGSMKEEQINLSTKLEPLLSAVMNSDWRIAINTTDPAAGCVTSVIDNEDQNIAVKFEDAVIGIGTSGSGNERGILQSINGLKSECLSEPWLRSSSTLAVVIISDEDNCSNGKGCGDAYGSKVEDLTNYLASIRDVGDQAKVYGVVSDPDNPCSTAYNHAPMYKSLVAQTGGTLGDICESDYSATLSKISENIAVQLKDQYALQYSPILNSVVTVKVNGVEKIRGTHFELTGNVVTFLEVPQEGSLISVEYSHYSNISEKFSLNKTAVSLESVLVDGSSANAELVDSGNAVIISPIPPEGARIEVKYLESVELINQVQIAQGIEESGIKMKIDGNEVSYSSYDANTGVVSLDSALNPGSVLEIEYEISDTPNLVYTLAFEDMHLMDGQFADGSYLAYSTFDGKVSIAKSSFVEGAKIILTYFLPPDAHMMFSVADGGKLSSLNISTLRKSCTVDNGLTVISGTQVDLSNCVLLMDESYRYSYDVETEFNNRFAVDLNGLEDKYPVQVWKVLVGEVLYTNYSVSSGVIVFDQNLPLNTTVTVEVRFY